MKLILSDGITLEVHIEGNTTSPYPPLLFIHGMRQCDAVWKEQVSSEVLLSKYTLISFDLRGHGHSDKPTDVYGGEVKHYTGKHFARDIKEVIEATCHGKKPVVCAWSFGATLLCDFVQEYGADGLSGVVWISPFTRSGSRIRPGAKPIDYKIFGEAFSPDLEVKRHALTQFVSLLTEVPLEAEFKELLIAMNMAASDSAIFSMYRGESDCLSILPRFATLPNLVVYGAKDAFVAEEDVLADAAALGKSQVLKLPEVGHSAFLEAPAVFNEQLDRFVLSLPLTRPSPVEAMGVGSAAGPFHFQGMHPDSSQREASLDA